MITTIRKKSGELLELESDDPLSVEEIMELCGESDGRASNPLMERMCAVMETLQTQKPPMVTIEAPRASLLEPIGHVTPMTPGKDWKEAEVSITAWDNIGRLKSMRIKKIF